MSNQSKIIAFPVKNHSDSSALSQEDRELLHPQLVSLKKVDSESGEQERKREKHSYGSVGDNFNAAKPHYSLGKALAKKGECDKAIYSYRKALEIDSHSAEIYQSLGDALVKNCELDEAVIVYKKAIELQPSLWKVHHNLGDILQEQGMLDEAVAAYRLAIKLNPDFCWSHNNLGDVLIKQEKWEEAAVAYGRAIELNPDFHWSHYNLGEALVELERWEEAIGAYRRAIELKSDLPCVYEKLGEALQKQSGPFADKAIDFYRQALHENPDDVQLYHQALALQSNNPELYLGLGQALEKQGEIEQSIIFQNIGLQQEQESDITENTTVFLFPDYRKTNPYQTLLYSHKPENCVIKTGNIDEAIQELKSQENSSEPRKLIFHLHWTSFVLAPANTPETAEALKNDFLQKLLEFLLKGGILMWTVHNILPHDCHYQQQEIALRTAIAAMASKIHIHSEKSLPEIEEVFPIPREKVQIIHHGHYLGFYQNHVSRDTARKRFGFQPKDIVFLFLGQIRPYKGIDDLLSAFVEIQKDFPNAHLLIAGKPVHPIKKGAIAAKAKLFPNITVIEESLPDDELQWFFNAADAVVFPYRKILTSGSVLTALSFNRPVIAPNVGMIAEIVRDEYNGFIYQLGNVKSLAKAMSKMAQINPEIQENLFKQSLEGIKFLTWNCTVKSLLSKITSGIKSEEIAIETEVVKCQIWNFLKTNTPRNGQVAILILNYNCTEDVVKLIVSIEQSQFQQFQICIVDNQSPNIDLNELVSLFNKHTIIRTSKNLGYAGGNNVGIQYVKQFGFDFVWILNPDTIVKPDTLASLVRAAETHKDISIYGSVICWTQNPEIVWFGGGVVKLSNQEFQTYHLYNGQHKNLIPDQIYDVDYVTGASIFCRTKIFDEVGLIPERYFLYFEETDWCLRAREKGHRIAIIPSSQLYHSKKSQVGVLPTKIYFYYYIRGSVLFMLKYFSQNHSLIESSIQNKFIQPWLEKIGKSAPKQVAYFTALAQQALEDGLADVTGPVDLLCIFKKQKTLTEINHPLDGCLEIINEQKITGWVWNKSQPLEHLEITIRIDGKAYINALADRYVEELKQRGCGDGNYGFEVKTPNSLFDSHLHTIEVFVDNFPIGSNAPNTVQFEPRPFKYKGRIDGIEDKKLKGWALDENNPHQTIAVQILDGTQVILEAECNVERIDLRKAGYENDRAGFLLPLPVAYCDGKNYSLSLKILGTEEVICTRSVKMPTDKYPLMSADSMEKMFEWLYHYREISMVHPENRNSIYLQQIEAWTHQLVKGFAKRPQNHLVSIIMPAYNRAKTIQTAMESVVAQSYGNWELIIADDGSSDNTVEVVQKFIEKHQADGIILIQLRSNGGVSKARNEAMKRARGDIFAYLDSDNTWEPDFLLIMMNALVDAQWAKVAYCGDRIWQHYPGNTTLNGALEISAIRLGHFNKSLIENRNYIDLNVFVHWRDIYDQLGGFREDMRRLVDWELIVRYTAVAVPKFVPALLANYHMGLCENQITKVENYNNNLHKMQETLSRIGQIECSSNASSLENKNHRNSLSLEVQTQIIIIGGDRDIDSLMLCLQAIAVNTALEGIKIVVYLSGSNRLRANQITEHFQEKADIEVRYSASCLFSDVVASATQQLPENSTMVLLSCEAIASAGWLPSLRNAAMSRDDIALVVPRDIRPKNDALAHKLVPYANNLNDIDIALSPAAKILTNPDFDATQLLIEVSQFQSFCLYFNQQFIERLDWERLAGMENTDWQKCVATIATSLNKLRIVYTPMSRVFHASYFR
ncbi:tetratricopeptide repeat protein [Microcoleus sp. N9_A1]|uniref:tetratricopeptide repeat protein n=1 Tax=Microcoleus sp. N9_A1 TaxID=3055380 RepID=UPI002FD351C2